MTLARINKDLENGVFSKNLRNDLFTPFEQVFDDFFTNFFAGTSVVDKVKATSGYPKMDVSLENNELTLRATIPGVKQEDITVEMIDNHTVEVSGKVSEEYNSKNGSYCLKELSKRNFTRKLSFKEELNDPKSASVKDGILTLKWDVKKTEIPKKRLIEVKQG